MLLRHPISRRGFLLGTSLAASSVLASPVANPVDPDPVVPLPPPSPPAAGPLAATVGLPTNPATEPWPAGGLSYVQMMSRFTVRGVTVNLDRPMPVQFSPTGDPIIYSNYSACNITSTSPASSSMTIRGVNGWEDGMMVDSDLGQEVQGWSNMAAHTGGATTNFAYNHELNIDPGTGKGALFIPQNTNRSYVKALRRMANVPSSGNIGPSTRDYIVISFVRYILPEHSFRPPIVGSKYVKPTWRGNNLAMNVLRSVAAISNNPLVGFSNGDQPAIKHALPRFMGMPRAEMLRRIDLPTLEDGNSYTGDSTGIGFQRLYGLLALMGGASNAIKAPHAQRVAQLAIDAWGARQLGDIGGWGAGQWYGYLPIMFYGAFLLQDNDLLNAAQRVTGNASRQQGFVKSHQVYHRVSVDSGVGPHPRPPEQVGTPRWIDKGRWGQGGLSTRYHHNVQVAGFEALAISLLQNGPAGMDGYQAFRNHEDQRAATTIQAMRDYVRWNEDRRGFISAHYLMGDQRALYETLDALCAAPDMPSRPDVPDGFFLRLESPQSGRIRLTANSALPLANPTITRMDFEHSNDGGYSWRRVTGYNRGLIVATPGYQEFARVRQVNAEGTGAWSFVYQRGRGGSPTPPPTIPDTSIIVAGSAPSGAPNCDPEIVWNPYREWECGHWNHHPVTNPAEVVEYVASWGYNTGGPITSATYQWRRNGTNIPAGEGGTSRSIFRRAEWGGQTLTCVVTMNGPGGSIIRTTPGIVLPTAPTLPGRTLFHADFTNRDRAEVRYAVDNAYTWNCSATSLRHTVAPLVADHFDGDIPTGFLMGHKSAARPMIAIPINLSARRGQTVRVTVKTACSSGSESTSESPYLGVHTRGQRPCYRWSNTGTPAAGSLTHGDFADLETKPEVIEFGIFTHSEVLPVPDNGSHWLLVGSHNLSASGGTSGGNPNIVEVLVEAV